MVSFVARNFRTAAQTLCAHMAKKLRYKTYFARQLNINHLHLILLEIRN